MQATGQTYGQAIPDQVDRISALFDSHLELLSDIRELYKDRVALEREYAGKLQILAKKAADKKAKTEAKLVLGEDPTKVWNETSLKQSTLNAAYDEIVNSMVNAAQDHVNISDALTSQVIDVLKAVERKSDDSKKKEMQFFQKLVSDKDRTNNERQKAKNTYDVECAEVETHRQKQGRTHDDRHADRAAKQAEQQRIDMLNSKNLYIISTAVANRTKSKFYNQDLPDLENQLQILQSRLVERFSKILLHAQTLQLSHCDVLKSRLTGVETSLNGINTAADQDIFIEYNIRPFDAPGDYSFEPCATFYDTDEMSVEPAPKVFLQNKLTRGQSKLQEIGPLLVSKRREFDQLVQLVSAYSADRTLGNIDEVSDNYLEAKHQLVYFSTSECILTTEIETIMSAVGDDVGGQHPHSFKSSSFSIPTSCGYCKSSIWGLSKQGKTCKTCGLSVHSKCELKVPANCQNETGSSSVSRKSTTNRSSLVPPQQQPPTASSFVQPVAEEEESYPVARLLFDFTATSEFELSTSEGTSVHVLEPDDGSGWVKVADGQGGDGLVPASYLAYDESDGFTGAGAAAAGTAQQGSGQHVRVIYPYQAGGSDELTLRDGETLELSSGPTGGQNYGDGWWEGVNSTGQKGIFPSNYVELV